MTTATIARNWQYQPAVVRACISEIIDNQRELEPLNPQQSQAHASKLEICF